MSAYMLYYDATPTVGNTVVVVSVMRLLPCRRGFRAASERLSPLHSVLPAVRASGAEIPQHVRIASAAARRYK